jgi:hypothetical protein
MAFGRGPFLHIRIYQQVASAL